MYFSRVQVMTNRQYSPQVRRLIYGNVYGVHQLLWDLFPAEKDRSFIFREEVAKEQLGVRRTARGEPIFYLVSRTKPSEESSFFKVESKKYSPVLQTGEELAFKLRANPVVARKRDGKKNSARHDIVMDSQRVLLEDLLRELNVTYNGRKNDLKQKILQLWTCANNQQMRKLLEDILERNERYKDKIVCLNNPKDLLEWGLKAYADKMLEEWLIEKGKQCGFELLRDEKRKRIRFQAEGYRWHALPKKGKSAGFSSVDFEGGLRITNVTLFKEALFYGIGRAKAFGCGLMLVRRL